MRTEPTISIVTPSFNQAAYVAWTARSVLLQLIIEQESETNPLFTTENLKSFIRYYGQGPQQAFAEFMNQSLSFYQHQQEQFSESFSDMMSKNPMKEFSDMYKKNMEMWEEMSRGLYGKPKKKD